MSWSNVAIRYAVQRAYHYNVTGTFFLTATVNIYDSLYQGQLYRPCHIEIVVPPSRFEGCGKRNKHYDCLWPLLYWGGEEVSSKKYDIMNMHQYVFTML